MTHRLALVLAVAVAGLGTVGGLWFSTRAPVADARGGTQGDRCAVHDLAFEDDVVPIRWGLPWYPDGYVDALQADFPNHNAWFEGGCTPGEESLARMRCCPACRDALRAWAREHAPDDWL